MARNELRWDNVHGNFGSSNHANAVGSQMLSNAGNMFSKVTEYSQEEAKRLNEERDKLFESAGKELSNIALQEGMEATVLSDGSVRHTFNADKYDQAISRIATERGYDQLDEDARAKIWASLNTNTDYQLGLANNQANAQNAIERDKLALDRRKINQHNQILNKEEYDGLLNSYMNVWLNPNNSPEQKSQMINNLKQGFINYRNKTTNEAEKATIDLILQDIENPQDLLNSINNDNLTYTASLMSGRYNVSQDSLNNMPAYNSLVQTQQQQNANKGLQTSINDGSFGVGIVNDVITNRKLNSTNFEDNPKLYNFINVLGKFYLDKTGNAEQARTLATKVLNKSIAIEDGKGTLSHDINEVMNDILLGNNTKEVNNLIGSLSEEDFNYLSKIVQDYEGVQLPLAPSKKQPISLAQETTQGEKELSNKYGFSVVNTNPNNVYKTSLFFNRKKGQTKQFFNNIQDINSENYKTQSLEATRYVNHPTRKNLEDKTSSDFYNYLENQFKIASNNSNKAIVLKKLLLSDKFKNYTQKVEQYKKAESSSEQDKLLQDIRTYEKDFIEMYDTLYKYVNDTQTSFDREKEQVRQNKNAF